MLWTGVQVHRRYTIFAVAILCACLTSSRPTPPTKPIIELQEEIARFFQGDYRSQHVQHLDALQDFRESGSEAQPFHRTTPDLGSHASTSASSWFPPTYSTPPLGYGANFQNHPVLFENHQMQSPVMGQHLTANDIYRKSPAPSNQFVSPMSMQAASSSSNSLYRIRPDVLLNQGIEGHEEYISPSSAWTLPHTSSPPQLHTFSQGQQQPIINFPAVHPFSSTRRPTVEEIQLVNEEKKALRDTQDLDQVFLESPGLKLIGDNFRTVIQTDDEVARFIARLRSILSVSREEGAEIEDFPLQMPVEVKGSFLDDPDTLAIRIFYVRTLVKQLVLNGETGPRHLLLTLSPQPRFLAQRAKPSVVGVWELGEVKSVGNSLLYIRGFYKFTPEEFEELGRIPQANVKQYWAVIRKIPPIGRSSPTLRLSLEKLDESGEYTKAESRYTAEVQQQLQSSNYGSGVRFGRQLTGRYLYSYEYSPKVAKLTQKWKEEAGLSQDAFMPIELTEEQRRDIGDSMKFSFHKPRAGKELDGPDGEPLMLVHYARLAYLPQHRTNTLAIWRFGPMIDQKQKLIVVGFYHLTTQMWREMTPQRLRGLQNVIFQYSWSGPRRWTGDIAETQAQASAIALAQPIQPVRRHAPAP